MTETSKNGPNDKNDKSGKSGKNGGGEHGHPRTTPSEAVGESGDQEARRQADEAVVADQSEGARAGRGGTPGRSAKEQSPGIGREEQVRPYPAEGGEGKGGKGR
ncbi:hypothetical protein GCM10010371_32490 [Streptomyces subrutilus]|uniref:Uncharacterized protein n=1 Tax=Streptomyces subrutilus TaxID=36818 RepID=A0A5P2UXU9_9ACTN|nr:hypothetical protein [Streptomyces subrutilus]QEU82341.1 hypothetical protein CP968_32385 [Streptomyces subrutilus]GGZ70111.1 hypothetical protein GCM10010371_32490 [Streptomyces subrutilus]